MQHHWLRRLVPAALLALPVLGGLWATSGPATLAAPYPFPTPACSTAQTGFGTGTAHAASSGTVYFSPKTGIGVVYPNGIPHMFAQGGQSWNFTTQLTNDASGGGNMTSSLRVVVNGVPSLGTVTFTPSCLLFSEVASTGTVTVAEVLMQGTATGFGPVTAVFTSEQFQESKESSGPVQLNIFELFPPYAGCQSLYGDGTPLLVTQAVGGQLTASVSGGSEGEPLLLRYVSTFAPCFGRASLQTLPALSSSLPQPVPLPIALP